MANRLAFDIGLHVNPGAAEISELEKQARRRVMAACIMFDRKWALLLGRPTTIKTQDVGIDVLPAVFGKPLSDSAIGNPMAGHAIIHRHMLELMELAGKIADFQNSTFGPAHVFPMKGAEDRAYLHFVGLERLFHSWYRRLPEHLAWKPANIKSAPMGFFMLHQQFHTCMILLHRPWAKYGPTPLDGVTDARYPSPESPCQENEGTGHLPSWMSPLPHQDNRASLSRSMCTQHAIRVARIFWHHRQRFDGRKIGMSAVQHAGTAALALMAALAHKSAELDHHSNLRYLQVLSAAIYDMSHAYQPAARMYHLLKTMLVEIRSEMVKSGGLDVSTVIGRYYPGGNGDHLAFGNSHWVAGAADRIDGISPEEDRVAKRRRLSSNSSMGLTCLPPSFLSNNNTGNEWCPTPPGSSQSQENSSPVSADQLSSDPTTFDLDVFHATFVDFINSGGKESKTQDWTSVSTDPAPQSTENPVTLPTPATTTKDASSPSGSANNTAQKANEAQSTTSPAAAPADDDDTAVDRTIEEWLAEPAEPSIVGPSGAQQGYNSTKNDKDSAGDGASNGGSSSPQPDFSAVLTAAESAPLLPGMTTDPLSVSDAAATAALLACAPPATPDGTPVCRDPYVVGLETELGLALGLGGADGTSINLNSTNNSNGNDNNNKNAVAGHSTCSDAGGMEMDWIMGTPGPGSVTAAEAEQHQQQQQQQPQKQHPQQPPRQPMTPVTLDELVQSVEEAVGSARARRAAAGSASAGATDASAGSGANADAGSGAGGESPLARNRELDFLSL